MSGGMSGNCQERAAALPGHQAWVAFAILGPVGLLGLSMFGRWVGSRRMRLAAMNAPVYVDPESRLPVPVQRGPAESRLPTLIVFGHGLMAGLTVLLVFLTAIG